MAITKIVNIEINSNTNKAIADFEKINESLNQTKQNAGQLSESFSKNEKASAFINSLGDSVGKLNPAFGSAIKGADGLIVKMWAIVANPVGAVLAAIVVALKFLYEAFENSVAGGKELKAIFAGLTATTDQIKDALFGMGRALINVAAAGAKFIALDFKGAAESMKKANKEAANSYGQLSSAISGTTAKVIYDLTKRQQANDKLAKEFEVVQSKQNALIAKSRETITDETASLYEKKKALEIVSKAESEVAAKNVKIAKENWDIVAGKAAIMKGEAAKKMKQELRDAEIKYWESVKENSLTGLRINRQQRQLNNQEAAQAKEISDAKKAHAKEVSDANKKAYDDMLNSLKEYINNEEIDLFVRRDKILNNHKLTNEDRLKLVKEINKKIMETEQLNGLEENDLFLNRYNDRKKLEEEQRKQIDDNRNAYDQKLLESRGITFTQELQQKSEQFKKDLELQKQHNDNLIAAEKELNEKKLKAKNEMLDNLAYIFGAETDLGKAFLIAKQALIARELVLEVQRTIAFSSRALAESQIAVAEGTAKTAKVGFPQNIPLLIAYAAQAFGIISAVKSAVSRAKVNIGSVSNSSASSTVSTPSPNFNIVGNTGVNQIAQTIAGQQPVKAYVVAKEVTTQQELDRNKITATRI